jgi:hypothetical protein
LKDGVSVATAAAELALPAPARAVDNAFLRCQRHEPPLQDLLVSPVRPALVVLTGAVGLCC